MIDEEHLRKLADAATEGPWEADYSEENNYSIKSPGTEWGDGYAYVGDRDNAEFIAAARTAVPQLLDQLDAVLDLHRPEMTYRLMDGEDFAREPDGEVCVVCREYYPCETVQAIDSVQQDEEKRDD